MGFCLYSLPLFHTASFTYNLTKTTTFTRDNRHFEGIHARSIISTVAQYPANNRQQLPENYQPSSWSPEYVESIASATINTKHINNKERADKLEEEVRCMLSDEHMEPLTLLELIDDIQRLGLAYRYKKSLAKALDRISVMEGATMGIENSMSAAALYFRLLRQHGYKVSADVFKSFKDRNGSSFKACLTKDVKGMLNLYEASYLSFETEDILKDAKAFTTLHLNKLKGSSTTTDTRLAEQVNHALEVPFHHGMGMLEARWHINEYSQRLDANPVLLELAVLDFNMVQSTLRNDLLHGSRWWSDVGLSKKLSFSRDRLVENFFFAVGIVSEPQFTKVRKGITKVTALITTIDDVYDVYASVDELELFTDVVVRWDINGAMKNLPDYMKICFLALYNTVHELAYDTLKEQNEMIIPHLTKAWADLCKAFLQEAKWRHHHSCPSPTFEDFLENAWISVSGVVILLHAYFLAGHNITKKSMKYFENTTSNYHHDLLRFPSMIFRLYNDLSSSKEEIKRGETINTISCYMRESGHSEEVAREYISKLIDETWKKMNAQLESESPFGRSFVETSMNLARITRCIYQYGDDHSDPCVRSTNRISSLIVEPIQQLMSSKK